MDQTPAAVRDPPAAPDGDDRCATPPPVGEPRPSIATPSGDAMDRRLTSIQPGGGVVMTLELAWGELRRRMLRKFRPGYVARMRSSRQGERGTLPFDPVDPRDLKYFRNQRTHWWADEDDPHRWRDALPFVRAGLAELVVLGGAAVAAAGLLGSLWWPLAIPPLVVAGLIVWFFRDPPRSIPSAPGAVVSPADGKLVAIERIDDPDIGPAVRIGIFLSIFNVHANRAATAGRVVRVDYRPGKMLNALRPESARENERLDVLLQAVEPEVPGRSDGGPGLVRVRQITGQFARRIVCWVRPGDELARGEMYGMIKLGSRTELVIPADDRLETVGRIGQKVRAGSTVLMRYRVSDGGS